jgi:hypothetical protein
MCRSMKKASITLPRLNLSDGTLEALKWLGLILMTGDHINKYLFNETLPVLFEAGRLAMPLFVFILAYNLARPGTMGKGVYKRTMVRLTIFGGLATPAFMALGGPRYGGWWPLNIMFTLLALTAICCLVEKGRIITGGLIFLIGGSLAEFWWPALGFGFSVWWYRKQPGWTAVVIALLSCASLGFINHDMWALTTLPVILSATFFDLHIPRCRLLFYAYYPLHLFILLLIRIPMRRAGYLFFM